MRKPISYVISELMSYRESSVAATKQFEKWKHNEVLCPRVERQLNRIRDGFLKYDSVAYDIQGIHDQGTDVVLRHDEEGASASEETRFTAFQIKGEWDLEQKDYVKGLRAQAYQALQEYRDNLDRYYVLLCFNARARREQIRTINKALSLDSRIVVVNPRYALTFLRLSEARVTSLVDSGARGGADRLPSLAAELVGLKVDILVAPGTPSALAAKEATKTIPIVMLYVGEPIGDGLVTSLSRPGGNVTGLSVFGPDIVAKCLEALKEAAPSVSRVAVWLDPTNPGHTSPDQQLDAAAKILGVRIERVDVRAAANLDAAFVAALKQREEALFVYPGSMAFLHVERIAQFAITNRLPTIAIYPNYVRAGMLMSYGPSIPDMYRRAGTYIDKILKGAKPGDLPVEQPTKFELVINLKTAKALGLTIPQSLLQRADDLIQ